MKGKFRLSALEPLAVRFVRGLGILLFLLLSVTSLLFTRYFIDDYSVERPYSRMDFFPLTLLFAVLLAALAAWLGRRIVRSPEKGERNLRILLLAVLAWILAAGTAWVFLADSTPIADQGMVYTSAQRFLEGNYGRLEYGKYLFYYPFQLGLVAYETVILGIFGSDNYHALQMMNVLGVALGVLSGYRILRLLLEKREAAAVYLLLMAGCFPLIVYCAYNYGDVLSIALSMTALWQLLRFLRLGKKSGAVGMTLALAAAVQLRNNSLIVLIAIVLVLLVKALSGRRLSCLLAAVLLLAVTLGSGSTLRLYYEKKTGIEINEGMPSILWIAMGMQEGEMEAGWYNGYSIYVYQDQCSYHGPTAAALGLAEVKARAKTFLKDPVYGVDFYFRKFTSQWDEPTYGCFIMTNAAEEGRSALGESLYTGLPNRLLKGYMNAYQLLIYGAALAALLYRRKGKDGQALEWYVLLIAVIGGALFHELWEAKSRYVLPYFIMMIPMAAQGLTELFASLRKWRTKDEAIQSGR